MELILAKAFSPFVLAQDIIAFSDLQQTQFGAKL